MIPYSWIDVALLALLMVATTTDLTRGKVPNLLNFSFLGLGIGLNALTTGWGVGLVGCVAAFGLMFPGWKLNAVRGGDAKLLMAVGAIAGPSDAIRACLLTYILNLPFGLIVLIARRRLGNLAAVVRSQIGGLLGRPTGEIPEVTRVAFVPVIAAAVLVTRTTEVLLWW